MFQVGEQVTEAQDRPLGPVQTAASCPAPAGRLPQKAPRLGQPVPGTGREGEGLFLPPRHTPELACGSPEARAERCELCHPSHGMSRSGGPERDSDLLKVTGLNWDENTEPWTPSPLRLSAGRAWSPRQRQRPGHRSRRPTPAPLSACLRPRLTPGPLTGCVTWPFALGSREK